MMKKAEMEEHHARYLDAVSRARSAERDNDLQSAVKHSLLALPHIDGMMRYAKKYLEREFDSIDAVELVCRIAPLIFDDAALDAVQQSLDEQKRVERGTSDNLGSRVDQARIQLRENHRLWRHFETVEDVRQDSLRTTIGGDQAHWRSTVERWERIGLVDRVPEGNSYRISMATRFDQFTTAKCSACGDCAEAPKFMFLTEMECMSCKQNAHFVLLQTQKSDSAEG